MSLLSIFLIFIATILVVVCAGENRLNFVSDRFKKEFFILTLENHATVESSSQLQPGSSPQAATILQFTSILPDVEARTFSVSNSGNVVLMLSTYYDVYYTINKGQSWTLATFSDSFSASSVTLSGNGETFFVYGDGILYGGSLSIPKNASSMVWQSLSNSILDSGQVWLSKQR